MNQSYQCFVVLACNYDGCRVVAAYGDKAKAEEHARKAQEYIDEFNKAVKAVRSACSIYIQMTECNPLDPGAEADDDYHVEETQLRSEVP